MPEKATARKRRGQAEVKAFLAAYPPQVRAIALKLRRMIFDVMPGAVETLNGCSPAPGNGRDTSSLHLSRRQTSPLYGLCLSAL